jgi:undecaprenyl-diphosphatase
MVESFLYFQAFLLGILQGVTEFLPISSSAHLILIPWLFRWNNPLIDSLTFDVALHAGTLLAILGYFRKDWMILIQGFFRIMIRQRVEGFDERLILYIILATVPAVIAGLGFQKMIEGSFRSAALIIWPLIAVSFLMIYAEKQRNSSQPLERLNLKDSLMIGFAQALALLPGISRSGITITTGLLRGYGREAATRFSFLLSTPVIAGATILQLRHLLSADMTLSEWSAFFIGFAAATLSGYLSITFLIRYLRRHTLNVFAAYRLLFAAVIIFWLIFKE